VLGGFYLYVCFLAERQYWLSSSYRKLARAVEEPYIPSQAPSTQEASGSPARSLASCCSWQAALEIQSCSTGGQLQWQRARNTYKSQLEQKTKYPLEIYSVCSLIGEALK